MSKKIIGLLGLVVIVGLLLAPAISLAQGGGGTGTDITPTQKEPPAYTDQDVIRLLPTIIKWVFGFLIGIVVLMIIIAGYLFVTGGGNPEQIGKARNFLMYALIGLAIAVLSRGLVALVQMIIGQPSGVPGP